MREIDDDICRRQTKPEVDSSTLGNLALSIENFDLLGANDQSWAIAMSNTEVQNESLSIWAGKSPELTPPTIDCRPSSSWIV